MEKFCCRATGDAKTLAKPRLNVKQNFIDFEIRKAHGERVNRTNPQSSINRRCRMTHSRAVSEELKRWRFYHGEDALIIAFCACVSLKMKGRDMDDFIFFSPPVQRERFCSHNSPSGGRGGLIDL